MTIKRRVRVALFLMMLVPALLMAGAFGIARWFTAGAPEGASFRRPLFLSAPARSFLADFNRLAVHDPSSLSDPRALASLDHAYAKEPWGWRLLRGGQELYRSASFNGGLRWRPRLRPTERSLPDMAWDFRFPDGSEGTLQLFLGMPWGSPFRGPVWFVAFLVVVVGCNGLLGWWISSSVISPLAKLREAANRIGEGDLGFRLATGGADEFGQVTGAFETMREKLQAAVNRQLAEEVSRKELIAHVSHDLRTPLNLIRGYAEGLRDGVAATPEMRERYLETILDRASELERLIDVLFSYSTLDLEGVQPELADVDLAGLLPGLRDSLAAMFPRASIRLVLPAPESPEGAPSAAIVVHADAELTRRVMSNLVENAVTHGARDRIALRWRVMRRAAEKVVEVSVTDDGVGVSADDLPRIFEPFFRADRARTRRDGKSGAGLGLSIVNRLMRAQGGAVRAASAPGGGLEVTLTFPEARANA